MEYLLPLRSLCEQMIYSKILGSKKSLTIYSGTTWQKLKKLWAGTLDQYLIF